uniref:Protein kinase domain-containing protein n=1 Tax=Leersia perrieri TaxID=77586 RepID=A0A0D9X6X9_9ORYZ
MAAAAVLDAAGLVSAILRAVRTARRNRRECRLLARRVVMVGDLLQQLLPPDSERRCGGRRALDGLGARRAPAGASQESGAVRGFITAGRQAEQFREVQSEINDYMLLFPVVSHIDLTRRLDLIYGMLLPPPPPPPGSQPLQQEITATEVIPFESNQAITELFEFGQSQVAGMFGRATGQRAEVEMALLVASALFTSVSSQYERELNLLTKLQHMNIIKLLGHCTGESELILLYEYMPNGSLDKFIHGPNREVLFDWSLRFQIIQGIAEGLQYLHTGYIAPEYLRQGILSTKVDVYAYGVILLEIITARRSTELLDAPLRNEDRIVEITRCIQIAWLCVQTDPADRPSMLDVLAMLRGEKNVPAPKKPGDLLPEGETSGEILPESETSGEIAHWFVSSGGTCSSSEFTVPR